MSKWTRMIVMTVGAAMLLGYGLACETTKGAAKDTQKLGKNIENSADRNMP